MTDAAYRDLLNEINRIPLIDTHDHLEEEGDLSRLKREGFGILMHYLACDLHAAGGGYPRGKPGMDPKDRFDLVAPQWRQIRFGAYMRTLERGLEAVHGIDHLSRENCADIEGRMMKFYANGGYRRALKELANIEVSLIDPLEADPVPGGRSHRGLDCDPEYFLCDYHERFTGAPSHSIAHARAESKADVNDFASWKRAIGDAIAAAAPYATGIKCTLGYGRVLDFAKVADSDAERIAGRAMCDEQVSHGEWLTLNNALVDHIAGVAGEHGLPLKFHTGLHAGGNNFLERADPTPLTDLIRRHPRTRFDLFHISYPYYREAAVMAKYYANVTVDLCWAWAFSPYETAQALHVLLDLVPVHKIFGFGGDYFHLEGVVGHALAAREGVARVLSERVRDGRHRESDALEIARIILHDGPAEHFSIEQKRSAVRAARAKRASAAGK